MRRWRSCSPRRRCCSSNRLYPRRRRFSPCSPYGYCRPCYPPFRRCRSYSPRRPLRCFDPLSPCSPCYSPDACDSCDLDCPLSCEPCFPRRYSHTYSYPGRYASCFSRRFNPCDPCYPGSCDPCLPRKYDPCRFDDCDPCSPCYRLDCDRCDPCYPPKYDSSCVPRKYGSCSIRTIDPCDPYSPLRCDSYIPRKPCYSPTRTFCLEKKGDSCRQSSCSPCTECTIGKRSEPLACDTFSKVCYPCDISTRRISWRRSPYCEPCEPNSSSNKSKSSCRLCKWDPCTLSYKSDIKGPCEVKCSSGDPHNDGPSHEFLRKSRSLGKSKHRFDPHFCPWEADVTVSGAIRGHCTSTAVEVARKMTGRFKSSGDRYTTDSQAKDSPGSSERQKMSLGCLDDGTRLDLSRNNRFSTCEEASNNYLCNVNKNKTTEESPEGVSIVENQTEKDNNLSMAETRDKRNRSNYSCDKKPPRQPGSKDSCKGLRNCRKLDTQYDFSKHKSASDSEIRPQSIPFERFGSEKDSCACRPEYVKEENRSPNSSVLSLDRDVTRFLNRRNKNRFLTRPETYPNELSSPRLMEDEVRSPIRLNTSPVLRELNCCSPRGHLRQMHVLDSPRNRLFSLSSRSEDDLDYRVYDREDCSPRTKCSDFYNEKSELPTGSSNYKPTPFDISCTDCKKSCLSRGTSRDGTSRFRNKRVSYDDEL